MKMSLLIWVFAFLLIFLSQPLFVLAQQCQNLPPGQVCTAFGAFDVQPSGFISKIFSIILSIAAVGALALIISSGFQLALSQGNQEKVQGAKEILTSAIVGLVFVIFSTVILTIVGVDILGLKTVFGK